VSLHTRRKVKPSDGVLLTRVAVRFQEFLDRCLRSTLTRVIGWSHPIHIHLIDFQVVARTGSGRQGVTPYEAAALKDVVYLGTNGKLASPTHEPHC
jgi:FtsP/CotA-like multicopper oxidase with cupredoxin domain